MLIPASVILISTLETFDLTVHLSLLSPGMYIISLALVLNIYMLQPYFSYSSLILRFIFMGVNIGSLVFSELFECGFYSLKVGKKNAVYYNLGLGLGLKRL